MLKKSIALMALASFLALPVAANAADAKIGYVNMRKVFFEYNKTKEFNQELEKEDEKVKKEIDEKTQEIRKLRDEIDLLSEKAKAQRQPELRQKITELDEFRRRRIQELVQKKDEMFKVVRNDIVKIAGEVGRKKGYEAIFDEAVLVYSSGKNDVTDEVLKDLNK